MADISGTNRADVITRSVASDGVEGGPATDGSDRIRAGNGDDEVRAGAGDDLVLGENGADRLWGDAGRDLAFGGNGPDEVHGGEGDDEVYGDNGPDRLSGDVGDDGVHGGRGTDEAVYSGIRANYGVSPTGDGGIRVEDLNGAADGRDEGTDTLDGIERLRFLGLTAPTTVLVSTSSMGELANGPSSTFGGPQISGNGRFVAFLSDATNLVPGDTNGVRDVFVKDLATGEVMLASSNSAGEPGNGTNFAVSISEDGSRVAFLSYADNLIPGEADGLVDIFVKDLGTGEVMLATENSGGSGGNSTPYYEYSISGNGRYVAFIEIFDNLLPGDANGASDILVKDLETGALVLASTDETGVQGNNGSSSPDLSSDGRYVAFYSAASNLVPGDLNSISDVFVKDLATGAVRLASSDSGGIQANNFSFQPSISGNGRHVAFVTSADNLGAPDFNGFFDVCMKDLETGALTSVSASTTGEAANGQSFGPSISSDGRFVAFGSNASNLAPDDLNGFSDVFVKDLETGAVTLVSMSSSGAMGNSFSANPSISANDSIVAFASSADNLVPGDTNGVSDVFVRNLRGGSGGETLYAVEPDGSLTPLDLGAARMTDDLSLG